MEELDLGGLKGLGCTRIEEERQEDRDKRASPLGDETSGEANKASDSLAIRSVQFGSSRSVSAPLGLDP